MNANLTELVCVVDRSGSMASIRDDAIGGFNTFLEGQQQAPGAARLTLVLFDDQYEVVHDRRPLADVPPLDAETFVPRGSTALLDAIARAIDGLGERLAKTKEAERPGKVIVAILTDGQENSSRHVTRHQVADRIAHQRDKYGWEFLFLAANQDAIASAASLQIAAADTMAFAATAEGVRDVYTALSARKSAAAAGRDSDFQDRPNLDVRAWAPSLFTRLRRTGRRACLDEIRGSAAYLDGDVVQ